LAALASLPTELVSDYFNWGAMEPASYGAELVWLPVALACQLALLDLLGPYMTPAKPAQAVLGRPTASAFGAELLLSFRFCYVALGWFLPALICIALFGLEPLWARILSAILVLAAIPPCLLYMLRRFFAAPVILWQGLNASESLAESARLSQGKLLKIFGPALLWGGIAVVLEYLFSDTLWKLLSLPLSFLLTQALTAWAYGILTL
jgi:hypothetical protein